MAYSYNDGPGLSENELEEEREFMKRLLEPKRPSLDKGPPKLSEKLVEIKRERKLRQNALGNEAWKWREIEKQRKARRERDKERRRLSKEERESKRLPWKEKLKNFGQCVYFIQDSPGNKVKIGYTTSIYSRFIDIERESPGCRLLGVLSGSKVDERVIHAMFYQFRDPDHQKYYSGYTEWFYLVKPIWFFIRHLCDYVD